VTARLPTPSQTVGPFFHDCLLRDGARCDTIVDASGRGTPIRIAGRVVDGAREGVPDAVIEVWQADVDGFYERHADDSGIGGFARIGTDERGAYSFTTVKPGRVAYDSARMQAPHLNVAVFARGLLNHLFTRMYFADEPSTASDPILGFVPADRRATLIARRDDDREAAGLTSAYRFDIVLQGDGETVFFDFKSAR